MGKMAKLLEGNQSALIGILGDVQIEVANDTTTLCSIIIKVKGQSVYVQASIGQLRALCKETARAVNNLLSIQRIEHKPITVDGETPL